MACGASSQVLGAAATRARVPRDVPDTSATLGGGSIHCGEPFERPTPIPILCLFVAYLQRLVEYSLLLISQVQPVNGCYCDFLRPRSERAGRENATCCVFSADSLI